MRQVYIIRHSIPNYEADSITKEGVTLCKKMRDTFPEFETVISSPSGRTRQTAFELTGKEAQVDNRARLPKVPPELKQVAVEKGKNHKYGFVGALFDIEEIKPDIKEAGQELVNLIKETLNNLSADKQALILSHLWTMAPAKKILTDESFDTPPENFGFIKGFIVAEDMSVVNV